MIKDLIDHPLKPLVGKNITINIEQITTVEGQDVVQLNMKMPKLDQLDPAALEYINSAFWVVIRRGDGVVAVRDG